MTYSNNALAIESVATVSLSGEVLNAGISGGGIALFAKRTVDPNKPASSQLPGSLKRDYPGEYLSNSLNELEELYKTAKGETRKKIYKAIKLLEQLQRLLDKPKG